MRAIAPAIISLWIVLPVVEAEAGVGTLLAKGCKGVSSKVQKAFGRGVTKTSGNKGSRTATTAAGRTASSVGVKAAAKAGRTATRTTADAAVTASSRVIKHLGVAGGTALAKLPPESAAKLADVSHLLARSPYKSQWMEAIGRYGSSCVDFLASHKSGIAVGTAATAVLLKPGDFLSAMGGAVEAGMNSAGEFVAKPMIGNAAEHVAKPMAMSVAASSSWHTFWNFVFITLFVVVAGKTFGRKGRP